MTERDTGIRQCVIDEIRSLAGQYHVQRVILFGSRARGDYHTKSDIDLAVSGGDYVRFALDVDEETSTLLEFDIVNLDGSVSEELRQEIDRDGRILYNANAVE